MRGRRCWLAVAALLVAGARPPEPTPAREARRETSLDLGWRFRDADAGAAAAQSGFDDRDWSRVSVPHSWNRIGSYTIARDPRTSLRQGIGWYRLHFDHRAAAPGRHQYVQFDGVGTIADVWLNGRHLGRHAGSFSRFRFDVTDVLRAGDNVLAVRADNSARGPDSATGAVIPLAGDFFLFGGIYRHVALIDTGPAHFDLLDDAGPGVYATTREVTDGTATIDVHARAEVPAGTQAEALLALDRPDGTPAAQQRVAIGTLAGHGVVAASLVVPAAHLWNGRRDPFLYRLRAEIRVAGQVTDRLVQPFGIRTFHLDPERGFSLNGAPLSLHGVSRHQDRLGVGWALTDDDQRQDMAMIADLGANAVRGAHYQHAPLWYDLADRYGMVMWAELPFVNQAGWRRAPGLDPAILANADQQLRELVKQNYNHPSIVTWSVGNETDIVDLGAATRDNSRAMLSALAAVAHREDGSRPISFADCCEPNYAAADPRPVSLVGVTDTIGYNRYSGWYYDQPGDLGPNLDRLHARHRGIPLSVTEYGAGGATGEHTDDPRGGPIASHGRVQPEEYQTLVIAENWRAIAERPYLWASWLWSMFDFASPRAEGDSSDLNTKGLVTADRRVRKDVYYYIQAHWSEVPVLHLAQARYVDRAYPVTDVTLFTNAATAALSVDGHALGARTCVDRMCVWPAVRLRAGVNRVTAQATIDGRAVRDTVAWRAPDPAAGLAIDAGSLLGGVADGIRFGSDAFFSGGEAAVAPAAAGEGGALPAAMAGTVRRGSFRYDLPLPNGRWRVALWFADPTPGAGRTFSVLAQGQPALTSFDVAGAGGATHAVRREVAIVVGDGHLRLDFRPGTGPALLAALHVVPER